MKAYMSNRMKRLMKSKEGRQIIENVVRGKYNSQQGNHGITFVDVPRKEMQKALDLVPESEVIEPFWKRMLSQLNHFIFALFG